eukprot:scaffold564122_cov39-Prasinocladus_malaysianus.AAC.2
MAGGRGERTPSYGRKPQRFTGGPSRTPLRSSRMRRYATMCEETTPTGASNVGAFLSPCTTSKTFTAIWWQTRQQGSPARPRLGQGAASCSQACTP